MDPVTLSALVSTIPGLFKAGTGLIQGQRAKEIQAGLVRPEYEIPASVEEALFSSKQQAGLTRLPGQDILEAKLASSTASGAKNIKEAADSSSSAIGAIAELYGQEMGARRGLEVDAANFYQQNQGQLRNMLNIHGQYQDKQFDMNEYQPYVESARASSALNEAQIQNLFSGVSDLAGVGANSMLLGGEEESEADYLNRLLNTSGPVNRDFSYLSQETDPTYGGGFLSGMSGFDPVSVGENYPGWKESIDQYTKPGLMFSSGLKLNK